MPFPIYLPVVLFFAVNAPIRSQYIGIIRTASIGSPSNSSGTYASQSGVVDCNRCVCRASQDAQIVLLTCTQIQPTNYSCQFYAQMPRLEDIQYPVNDTTVYIMRNGTFVEQDDCCNTTYLVGKINATTVESGFTSNSLRTLVEGDGNTLAAVASSPSRLLKFDRTTLALVQTSTISGLTSAGYHDGRYYLGTTAKTFHVYDANLTSNRGTVSVGNDITTIKFLQGSRMLVGSSPAGVLIYGKDANNDYRSRTGDPPLDGGKQTHAVGVLNTTAFYSGAYITGNVIRLFIQNAAQTWVESSSDAINIGEKTSDFVVDNCQRIWAVRPESDRIYIYERNKPGRHEIVVKPSLFNLVILGNYTLVTSHESSAVGLSRIRPALNCRAPN